MTKKSIQMLKLETFDFKLKLKLIVEEVNPLGTSLDSATMFSGKTQMCRVKSIFIRVETLISSFEFPI